MNDLVLVPTAAAETNANGDLLVAKAFIEQLEGWAQHWPGTLRVLLTRALRPDPHSVVVDRAQHPYDLRLVDMQSPTVVPHLQGAAVVLAEAHGRHAALPHACRQAGVPFVYETAQTLRTRLRQLRSGGASSLWRAHRSYREWALERRHFRAIQECAGLHCNGTPTFDAYRRLNPNALLYFESRVRQHLVVGADVLAARLAELDTHGPLRLAYAGSLNRAHGTDLLVPLAQKLRERGVPFFMSICGDGPAVPQIRRQIQHLKLQRHVALTGNLDFAAELVPFLQTGCDLFVCCHRDGEPTRVYAETLACGVPIVGYANEAFSGLLERVDIGRAAPTGNIDALADLVLRLSMHRDTLDRWARQARAFGEEHTFDASFARRVEHLRGIAAQPPPVVAI